MKKLEKNGVRQKNRQKNSPVKAKSLTLTDIIEWLAGVEKGRKSKKAINASVEMHAKESDANVAFETVDKSRKPGIREILAYISTA